MKKNLPKPGKSGEGKIDDKFCQLEAGFECWNRIKEMFFWDIEGKKMFSNDLPQQNIDYGDFNIIKEINNNKYHKISRMISKENFSYIDHNFKLLKNKTIQNTYVIILSSNNNIDITKILTYDFL